MIKLLALYYVVFWAIWALIELVCNPFFENVYNAWQAAILASVVKLLIWTFPCILLIKRFKDDMFVSLKGMFFNRVNWLKYIPLFLIFGIYILCGGLIKYGKIAINANFSPILLIGCFLFVGITEELVFRGWILNASLKIMKTSYAVLLNSILFLCIHIPIWFHSGTFISSFTSGGFVSILALGIIFSMTFIKSKSILVPIALHMFWDLTMVLIFAG